MFFSKLLLRFLYLWPFTKGRYRLFSLFSEETKAKFDKLPQPVPMKTGVKLFLRPSDHLSRVFRYFGSYEPYTGEMLRKHADREAVFVDIGANLGLHSLGVAKDVGCPVVAFEPGTKTADCLDKSIVANGLESKVKVFRVALAAENGTATFVEPINHVGQSALESPSDPSHRDGNRFEVNVARLDSFEEFHSHLNKLGKKVGLIKMDIEGAEEEALKGMVKLLQEHRPKIIMEIYDGNLHGFDSSISAIKEWLESLDYELVKEFEWNGLFIPKAEEPESMRPQSRGVAPT